MLTENYMYFCKKDVLIEIPGHLLAAHLKIHRQPRPSCSLWLQLHAIDSIFKIIKHCIWRKKPTTTFNWIYLAKWRIKVLHIEPGCRLLSADGKNHPILRATWSAVVKLRPIRWRMEIQIISFTICSCNTFSLSW